MWLLYGSQKQRITAEVYSENLTEANESDTIDNSIFEIYNESEEIL